MTNYFTNIYISTISVFCTKIVKNGQEINAADLQVTCSSMHHDCKFCMHKNKSKNHLYLIENTYLSN